MDRRIQEVRQRIARRTSTGNQVIGDHYFFGAAEYQDDFEEWLKDEATRLNIFGDKLVIEVMKAHERMAKEEKEKDKKEKKEG